MMEERICKIFGHKFTDMELLMFRIKNNPTNIVRRGFSNIQCPRCKVVFSFLNTDREGVKVL